ncbi:MAG: TolB family protein [Salinibacter sp.]|uniref:TolB family protein n=1 Tax=Salinibacter sp. TaxID=2065818 RepID=UPI0035D3DA1F
MPFPSTARPPGDLATPSRALVSSGRQASPGPRGGAPPATQAAPPILVVLLLAGALALGAAPARAQINYSAQYRPPLDYRAAQTEHFRLLYPVGADTTAALFRRALEGRFEATRSVVGTTAGEDFRLPVIVDPRADRPNGYVTARNFRMKLFTAHPVGATGLFGAKLDSWAQTVAPHELTHAMHLEIDSGVGVGGLLGLFSEDASRALHSIAPPGWVEGIAVYRESQIDPDAGRLNAPLPAMKYRASLTSDDPWSVGELMYPSPYERPSGRHYLGGGQLIEHMAERRGSTDFFRRTTRWAHRLPFLGFGAALWMGTGDTPAQISGSFLQEERREERRRLDALRDVTDPAVVAGSDGLSVRRPYWLSDSTLVAYVAGYATRPGFYRIDAASGEREAIGHQSVTQGHGYALGPDTTALHFARPHYDAIVRRKTVYRAHRLDLRTGEAERVSTAGGVFAPAPQAGGPVWAARRDGSFSTLVVLRGDSAALRAGRPGLRYKQVAPSPSGDTVAVLANDGGRQGLYHFSAGPSALEPWLRFEEGTIYDMSWGPEGRYLLFAADPSGTANVYALDTRDGDVQRLTTVRYGALEPALSPDGRTLAFVRYRHERFELVRMPFRPGEGRPAADIERRWAPEGLAAAGAGSSAPPGTTGGTSSGTEGRPDLGTAALREGARPYRAWRHLAPRSVRPVLPGALEEAGAAAAGEDLRPGIGARLSGADPLRTWAYALEGFYRAGRLWGEATVETGLLPGTPRARAFARPFEATATPEGGPARLAAYEERGLGLSARQTLLAERNVYVTSVTAGLEAQFRQTRPLTAAGEPEGGFAGRLTLRPRLVARYRLQQNVRDLVPNTGLVSATRVEADVATSAPATPSRALIHQTNAYWPLLSSANVGLRTSAAFLTQSRGALFDAQSFVPRGYQDLAAARPGPGTYLRLGAKLTWPLGYVDAGSVMVPVIIDALYGYGLGQAQYRIERGPGPPIGERRASVSGGLGVAGRPLGHVPVRLELGLSRRFDAGPSAGGPWEPHLRILTPL